jgi:thiol:disulfide interchange protein
MKQASVWGVVTVLALVVAVVVLNRGAGSSSQPGGGAVALPWERDLSSALARAGSENKIVMVDFYTDWCGWCRRFDQNTLSDSNVQRALERVVSVRLNAEKDGREAAERFRVDEYPTILFLDARGEEVGRISGYFEPGPFLAEIEDIIRKA